MAFLPLWTFRLIEVDPAGSTQQRATRARGEASCDPSPGAAGLDQAKMRPAGQGKPGAQPGVLLVETAGGTRRPESPGVTLMAPDDEPSTRQEPLKTRGLDASCHAVSERVGEGRKNGPARTRTGNLEIMSPSL